MSSVNPVLRTVLVIVLGVPALVIVLHSLVRLVRAVYKFPMPQAAANLIDNPLRRRIQPPEEMAKRHGLAPGMTVLDVGPGNGTYTLAAARHVGERGKVVAVDIEPKMIERVQRRVAVEGATNIEARVADVYDLPFDDGSIDAVTMIAVIGELPQPVRALRELHRVLSPIGTVACSELLLDPDYPRARKLARLAAAAGFQVRKKTGGFFHYTLMLEKGG